MSLARAAEATNLSISTISRVLNGKSCVAEATQQKVLAACRELGVFPTRRGKRATERLAGQSTTVAPVAVLMDMAISTTFLSELVVAIQRQLAEYGYQCSLQTFSGEYEDFLRALPLIQPVNASACIAVGYFSDREVEAVTNANPKSVFVDYTPSPSLKQPINAVSHNNLGAVRLAVDQLVSAGCGKIACLQGMAPHHFSRAMREGFLQALGQADFAEGQLLTGNFTPESAYKALCVALAGGLELDGLFTTDEMAFGAMRALQEACERVPGDVKIMGCDGIEWGRQSMPSLSTVILDRDALGRRGVKRLMEIIDLDKPTFEQILLPPKLEIRESCRP